MNRRSGWKQHAAIAASAEGRTASDFPQTIAALELWARDNSRYGMVRYQSPLTSVEAYGTRIDPEFGSFEQMNEMSQRTDQAVQSLPAEFLQLIRAHYLHRLFVNDRIIPIPHDMPIPRRARRYLSMGRDRYYDMLAASHARIAIDLGFDGY
jgi:hypothetical protein